jgi:hypothetical protein
MTVKFDIPKKPVKPKPKPFSHHDYVNHLNEDVLDEGNYLKIESDEI